MYSEAIPNAVWDLLLRLDSIAQMRFCYLGGGTALVKPIDSRIPNLKMADPKDIGRKKLLAIGSRGSKKDFVDLYCLTREVIPLESLLTLAMEEDHGVQYSKLLFLKGLVDFEEADREPDPALLWDIGWENVKKCLTDEVRQIAANIQ